MNKPDNTKTNTYLVKIALLSFFFLAVATSNLIANQQKTRDWDKIVETAAGKTVDWYMWGGSPAVNGYVNGFVAEKLKEKYNITLRQVPVKDIGEIVSKLVVEKKAGKDKGGSVDLMWINGENFRTCKRYNLLHGPFTQKLPNNTFIDWSNPSIANDFGTPVKGLETPWGSAQVVMIYDKKRTPNPPTTIKKLITWIQQHPNRFTYPAPPDFTGSAFVRQLFYHSNGEVEKWQGDFTPEQLHSGMKNTYDLLLKLKPYLWRQGTTYPSSPVQMHTLFADGEIDLSFTYQQSEASRFIQDGLFPPTARTFVFKEGTIANTHFTAIPSNAADKEAAMVVANFLISPEAQLEKAKNDVWGDFPAIDISRLPQSMQKQFDNLPKGIATLPTDELQQHQLPELPGSAITELERGWRKFILKGQ